MANASPARVLVVDDEESVRTFAQEVLRRRGYEVTIAADGREALQIIEREPPFDLFVIDVVMPEMYGDEVARRIRQRERDAKVLYFTGFSDRLFKDHPTLWQNEAFLDKPVDIKGLLEAVSLLLYGHTRGPQ